MPKTADTPFVVFDPIKNFTNRERQVQAFDRLWDTPQPWVFFLHGLSGNGKSTFMRYVIATRCASQKLAYTQLYLDSPDAATNRFQMAATLAEGLRAYLPVKHFDHFEQQRREILTELQNQRANLRITQIVKAGAGATVSNVAQDAVMRQAHEMEKIAHSRLADAFVDLAIALPQKAVFFLDGYEALQRTGDRGLSGWLWNMLERCQKLCPGLRAVVGCQDPPQLPLDFGVADDDLHPFKLHDTQQLFDNLGIKTPGLAQAVQEFTQGHALLVAMAAQEALAGSLTLAEIRQAIEDKRKAEEWLFQRVIGRLPEPHQTALPWLALLRRFNHDSLNHLLTDYGVRFTEKDFRALQQFSFVRYDRGWWRCHDLIRRTQQRYQSQAHPQETIVFYKRAQQYHASRGQAESREADQVDGLYYHFLLEPKIGHERWNEVLLETKKNWRREFWGELIKVADEASEGATREIQADIAFERGYYGLRQYEMDAAIKAYNDALALFKAVGDRLGEANTLKAIGDVHRFKDDNDAAIKAYNDALALFKAVGDRLGEANTLQAIGDVHRFKDDNDAAIKAYNDALALFKAVGDRLGEANTLKAIGDVHRFKDDNDAAIKAYNDALALFKAVGSRLGEANTLKAFGQLYHAEKKYDKARANFEAAIAGHTAIRDRYSVAVDLYYFSFTQESLGQTAAAIHSVELALQTCLALNLSWTEMAMKRLFNLKKMNETDFQNYLAALAQQWGLR